MDDFDSSSSVLPLLFRRNVVFVTLSVRVPLGVEMVDVRITGFGVDGRKNGDLGLS